MDRTRLRAMIILSDGPTEQLSGRRAFYRFGDIGVCTYRYEPGKFAIREIFRFSECIPVAKGDRIEWIPAERKDRKLRRPSGYVCDVLDSGVIVVSFKWTSRDLNLTKRAKILPFQVKGKL